MAIRNKILAGSRKVSARATHHKNHESENDLQDSDTDLKNNGTANLLIDPNDIEPFNTHSVNASTDESVMDIVGPDLTEDAIEDLDERMEQTLANLLTSAEDDDLPNDSHNVGTIPNDVDPTIGYDINASDDDQDDDDDDSDIDDDDDDDDDVDSDIDGDDDDSYIDDDDDEDDDEDEDEDEELDASQAELDVPNAPSNLLEADELEDFLDNEPPLQEDLDEEEEEFDSQEPSLIDAVEDVGTGDVMDVVDVDEVEDTETDLSFATTASSVLVLRKDRVIAKLTKKRAIAAGVESEMFSDEFQDAVVAECKRYGLRAGLKTLGFRLATINVGASAATSKRVEARVKAATKAVRATYSNKHKGFEHCLALASVGMTKNFWKDVPNDLRAGLEQQLTQAGVRGASKIVAQAFAQHAVSYSKSIITLAQRLAEMPEATRNTLAAALDMTSDEGPEELETDAVDFGLGDDGDLVDASDDFDDLDEDVEASSVTAALSQAGRPDRGVLLTPSKTPLSARAVLDGSESLF